MLTSVEIESFRSCKKVHIDELGTLTALIGRNGAGKTNVLKAIEWGAMSATGKPFDGHRWDTTSDGAVKLSFEIGGAGYRYEVSRSSELLQDAKKVPTFSTTLIERLVRTAPQEQVLLDRKKEQISLIGDPVPREISVSGTAAAIPSVLSLLPADNSLGRELTAVVNFLSGVTYYPLDFTAANLSAYFIQGEELAKWRAGSGKPKSSLEATALKIVTLFLDRNEEFGELAELLGQHGLGLIEEVSVLSVGPVKSSADDETQSFILSFTPVDGETSHPLQQLSFGTQRLVQLITSLVYDRATVALIEQPEDGIHPGLLHKLTPLLRQYAYGNQYMLASHAPAVLNRMSPEELRIVRREAGVTSVESLSEEQLASARLFLEEDGPLSDYIDAL